MDRLRTAAAALSPVLVEPRVRHDEERRLNDPGEDREDERAADDHDASGFCVCAPMPFDSAAGRRPRVATRVVMSTGRNRFLRCLPCRELDGVALRLAQALEVRHDEDRILDSRSRRFEMKPIAADTEKLIPVMSSARTPPVHAMGMLMMTSIVSSQFLTALVREERDEQHGQRDDDLQTPFRFVQLVDLPPHSRRVS